MGHEFTIRLGTPDDDRAIARVAALDSSRSPQGTSLVAEVDGTLVAALSMEDGRLVADPFRPTAHVAEMLRLRAEHLRHARRVRTRRPRVGVLLRPVR